MTLELTRCSETVIDLERDHVNWMHGETFSTCSQDSAINSEEPSHELGQLPRAQQGGFGCDKKASRQHSKHCLANVGDFFSFLTPELGLKAGRPSWNDDWDGEEDWLQSNPLRDTSQRAIPLVPRAIGWMLSADSTQNCG